MAVDGKEDYVDEGHTEASRETEVSENVKENAEVVEGNGEINKENENTKQTETNGPCNSFDGNEKKFFKEEIKRDDPSNGNEEKNAIGDVVMHVSRENEKKKSHECDEDGISSDENDKDNARDGELPLASEENASISNLTDFEKKALMEFRSKIEEAILSNTLCANKEESSQNELYSVENEEKSTINVEENHKKSETNVEIDENISLWGVPLLPSKEDERTDMLLFKFLKARDWKPNDALEMLKNTLEWRKENKIDSIMEEDLGVDRDYDSVAFMKGFDREGHPICYNVYEVFANEEMYNNTFGNEASREKFIRWRIQLLEKEIVKLDFRPGGICTLLQVNDLKNTPGPSRRDLRLATKRALGIFQDNYPEFVARNIFINVPFWYYAFNAVLSPFLMQRTKSKFVFSRPSWVTNTLLKYIAAEEIPVAYGGLRQENDPEFSTKDVALEINVKAGATEIIEIPVPEVGNTLIWEVSITGWDVNYREEFVPRDEGSYTLIVKKGRKISWQQEPVRNSFKNKEAGKVVITIDNTMFKKKRVFYRYKTKTHHSC